MEFHALTAGLPPYYWDFEAIRIGKALVFRGAVEVDGAGQRRVAIIFPGRPSRVRPIVMVDGPRRSRHRFYWSRPTSLCLYYARDPENMQWTLKHRLHILIDLIRLHLVKEAYWRATNEWPAPEVHVGPRDTERGTGGSRPRSLSPGRQLRLERQPCWCGRGRYASCHGAIPAEQELRQLGLD